MQTLLASVILTAVATVAIRVKSTEIVQQDEKDQSRPGQESTAFCWSGDCSKCQFCGDCVNSFGKCSWISSMKTVSPHDGRWPGSPGFNGTWFGLTNAEAAQRASSSLNTVDELLGDQFAGRCEQYDANQWDDHYVAVAITTVHPSPFAYARTARPLRKGTFAGSCEDFKAMIEDELTRDDNQHQDVLRKNLERAAQDRATKELRDIVQSSFEEAAKASANPVAILEAVSKCLSNTADKFFQRVHRVLVSDLVEYALLDSHFDDRHDRGQTDQAIINELKGIDPFEWKVQGQWDPIKIWICRNPSDMDMMISIESGRHRAAAAMQASMDYVPVQFDCRLGSEPWTGEKELQSASDIREKLKNAYPNSFLPLECEGRYPVGAGREC